jgi:glutamate-1-semialdehyde 2,1-aminomutase
VPSSFVAHTIVLPLDDEDGFRKVMAERGHEIAAVLIEPIPANSGLLVQRPSFLELLREKCSEHGAMLIFDEVISGFRVAPAGAAGLYGITPDLATYGKVIGGGLPVGAYGGPRATMEHLAPLGDVYQAGTLSGNPVAMAAGTATLRQLLDNGGASYRRLEEVSARLEDGIRSVLAGHRTGWSVVRVGSILWLVLQEGEPPRTSECISSEAVGRYARLHTALLERHVYLAPSAYEVMFVSRAHDEEAIDETIAAFDEAVGAVC